MIGVGSHDMIDGIAYWICGWLGHLSLGFEVDGRNDCLVVLSITLGSILMC